jgi:hypothetical protein
VQKNCHRYFCHLCPCSSKDILFYKGGNNRCNRCKAKHNAKCYHWEVGDEDTIERFQQIPKEEVKEYFETCGSPLNEVVEKCKMKYQPSAINKESDFYNIEFQINDADDDDAMEKLYAFSSLLTEVLQLRNLAVDGTLGERRERLKTQMMVEERWKLILLAVQQSEEGREAALMLIKQVIPCIMHLENRSGEKILTMLLGVGAEIHQKRRPGSSLQLYLQVVENIVTKTILGTPWRPKQWRVPLKDGAYEIGKNSLSNSTTHEFMARVMPLVETIFQHMDDEATQTEWQQMINHYNIAIELLRSPTEFSDEDIETFQSHADIFYHKWIELVGQEGITYYIHVLGSGHISHYLKQHKNLYKFSQQNWESINEYMKITYFCNTQRGGKYG